MARFCNKVIIITTHRQFVCHKKDKRSAKCIKCRQSIARGTNCFVIDGALNVPYNSERAVEHKVYSCPTCILGVSPPSTNIRPPTRFQASEEMTEQECQMIETTCNFELDY